jgi:RNA polymerase sigma factor (sigma-70 family)
VTANLRLVNLVVNRFAPVAKTMTHSDLMQEGSLGLMRAVEKFDPSRGTTLAGYAVPWIRASIVRALEWKDSFVR